MTLQHDPGQARPFRVMKFGGSSVGAADRLFQALDLIARERQAGPVAVVVSAMADTTDRLIAAVDAAAAGLAADPHVDAIEALVVGVARDLTDRLQRAGLLVHVPEDLSPAISELMRPLRQLLLGVGLVRERTLQTRDLALSFGERASVLVVRALLVARGVDAVAVDARDWTVTDDRFGQATPDLGASALQLGDLSAAWSGAVSVHTGFLGRTRDGRTTTLGRNGSDYTAALLAQILGAAELQIWTDVSGVMTADPDLVLEAYPVAHLSQAEALELGDLGMILHPRTMAPLIEARIPLRVRNTARPADPGTLIDVVGTRDERHPVCVVSTEDLALLDLETRRRLGHERIGERALRALANAGVPVWVGTSAPRDRAFAVAVARQDAARAEAALTAEFGRTTDGEPIELAPIRVRQPVTLLTLVGEAMGRTPNVAGRFFGALGQIGVLVRASAQGAGERSISAVIDGEDTATAVRTVHAAFNLAAQEVNLLVLGKGTVGRELLGQIAAQQQALASNQDVFIKLAGVVDSKRAVFDPAGIPAAQWDVRLQESHVPPDIPALLERLRRLPVPILVDCTADDTSAVYEAALACGIHVVGANKRPLAAAWPIRQGLMDMARKRHRRWEYETTVGASLPVIDTLKGLVRTGDAILRIEGSFSGTLGYLAGELSRGVPLSHAVRDARARGYTEPHPRDDLSGLDVARKALILARELGMELDLDAVAIEPFAPPEALGHDDLERFFLALAGHDAAVAARIERMRQAGRVLRYLAQIDPSAPAGVPAVRVGPVEVEPDHPAARLRGTEAFVAFTTDRHRAYPLLVQGAGAGGAVTAAGVLTDILKIAMSLRGR
ncbi:aspartate kinase [Nannocystis sp. SCPEA4]|uniref:aspartate kinase n=1 Tax=Nannocystis sp. SCPEA4 TaxID=2996787 RepID=UPI0022715C35|nr:aspartate kinase [Nannocystis sp. SCPEA4]MCY1062198.1 aspartate kinase [Nannocystis sp. SCPEA4]